MKQLAVLMLAAALAAPAFPQAKQPASGKKSQKAQKTSPTDLRAEAAQGAQQLKLLIRFLYLYGRISTGLETADEQARRGEITPQQQAQIQKNKADVAANISSLRTGLEKLAQSYHSNERLQRQYLRVLAASEMAAKAEELANANRFDEAGRMLLGVADRLADLLVEVR